MNQKLFTISVIFILTMLGLILATTSYADTPGQGADLGQTCDPQGNACRPPYFCDPSTETCSMPTGLGQICQNSSDCNTPFFCNKITQTCAMPQPSGSVCEKDTECQSPLFCNSLTSVCASKTAVGGECSSDQECASSSCQGAVLDASGAATTKGKCIENPYRLPNFLNVNDPTELIGRLIKIIIGFIGSIALLMFIYGGIRWLTSGGVPENVKKGKDAMVWSAIGMAVIFSAYIVVNFVFKLFGK